MKLVKINKAKLIVAIQANRDNHKAELAEALEVYRKNVIATLNRKLAAVKAGKKVRNVYFEIPQDNTKEYDRALKMLDMSVDDIIELDQREFQQYVMDEWNWKGDFNRAYMSNVSSLSGSLPQDDEED